jgi:hypothetical protein
MSRPWLVLVMLVVPAVAYAKPKVALAPFAGDTKDHARHAVASSLDHDTAVVDDRDDADAVVQGKVSKEDKGNVLRVQLFVHGKKSTTFYVPYTDLASKKFKRTVHDHVMSKLAKADDEDAKPAKKVAKADDEDAKPAKKVAKADDDDAKPAKKNAKSSKRAAKADDEDAKPAKKVAKADDDDAKPAKKAAKDDDDVKSALKTAKSDDEKPAKGDDDDDKPAKKAKKRVARGDDAEGDSDDAPSIAKTAPLAEQGGRGMARAGVIVEGGASASSRILTYSTRGFDQAPPSYHNAGVPGARVAGELYPLALTGSNSPAAGIGVAGSYDKTLGLSVAAPGTVDTPGAKLAVDQHQWSVGARYRYGWVTFAADYGHHAFEIKRTMPIDVPDVDYAGFEPGVDVRVPLGNKFALRAGGRAMLLKSAGPIQSNDSYGRTHITGGHAMVGVDVAVANRVALRLAGEAMILKMTFYGTGIESTSRDGDPTTIDVGGATDKYFGGSATLAVFY